MRYDVIIIGSGLGGLACAHVLSKAGMSVLVLEKGRQAGGCLQSYRRGQYSFDTGFHYVGGLDEGQSLHAAFRMLGLLDLPWRRLDNAFDRIMIGERRFSFVQGYEAFAEHLRGSFPSENEALRSYTTLLRQAGERQLRALDSGNGAGDFPDAMFGMAAWRYLTDHFRDPLLIDVLSATSLKMELRKASLPLFTFVHGNGSFIESSWRLAGDGSLIVDSLVRDIRAWGGQVVCRSEVVELLGKDGRLVAARCSNGELYEGKLFISDAHPAVTCGWIGPDVGLRGIYRRRLDGLENTFGMLTVSLVIKPRMLRYFNWNQYIYRQGNVWDCCREDRLVGGLLVSARVPEEDDGYLRQVDLLTPMTWNRFAGWEGTRIGCRGEDYVALKERLADECVALAERFIPGLQRMIESRYISTPLTYGNYTATPQGSAYGPRKDYNNPLMMVLSSRTPIRNLLLTGQGLILHGLHGVTMTALLTCAEVLGKEYMWKQLNR